MAAGTAPAPAPAEAASVPRARVALLVLLAIALAATGEYSALGPQRRANQAAEQRLAQLRANNDKLRGLAGQLEKLRAENAQLTLQWQAAQAMLPELRASDDFLRQLEAAARAAQVSLRTVTAQPPVSKALYIEAPYSLQLDGSFASLLRFYDQLTRLPQLMSVSDWNVTALASLSGGAKRYQYRAGSTLHAVCKISTYYSPGGGKP